MKQVFNFVFLIIIFSCQSNKEKLAGTFLERYSSVSIETFTINGLKLITDRDSMVLMMGRPNKEVLYYHVSDTLKTIFYFLGDCEVAFSPINDLIVFSHAFFESSDFVLTNKIGKFTSETKLEAMKVVFPESYNGKVRISDKDILYIRVVELENATVRMEFVQGFLYAVHFDYSLP
jgi:hypothetical protein